MRRSPRFLIVALPVGALVTALWLRPAPAPEDPFPPPTIEPALPLTIDLKIEPGDPGGGEPARLLAAVDASGDLLDLALSLALPDEVAADGGALLSWPAFALRSGERRIFSVPLRARRAAAFPIRLEASFRLPDGRVFRTQQGVLWRAGGGAPEGRRHAGAYEWFGVPVEEPQP